MQVAQEVEVQSIASLKEQLDQELVLLAGQVEVHARHVVLLERREDDVEDRLPIATRVDAPIKGPEGFRHPLKTFRKYGRRHIFLFATRRVVEKNEKKRPKKKNGRGIFLNLTRLDQPEFRGL